MQGFSREKFSRMRVVCKQSELAIEMTAGSVAVPTIIPLKVHSGPKHFIDTATPLELRSGK